MERGGYILAYLLPAAAVVAVAMEVTVALALVGQEAHTVAVAVRGLGMLLAAALSTVWEGRAEVLGCV